jgi:hypothetical protein
MTLIDLQELPPVPDMALEIAWMAHARQALDDAPDLVGCTDRGSTCNQLDMIAEEIGPGGRIDTHPAYPTVVLYAASRILPGGDWKREGVLANPQNGFPAAQMGAEFPYREMILPYRLVAGQGGRELEQLALGDAARRLGLAERDAAARRTFWTAGAMAAAGYFRAKPKDAFDLKVFMHWEKLKETLKQFSYLQRKMIGGYSIYGWANMRRIHPETAAERDGRGVRHRYVDNPFWAAIMDDRQRFLEVRARLSDS